MLIYLDTCSIQRPIDDRSQLRINMEAEAIITVLHMIETGEIDLLSSEILEFEISKIPSMNRKHRASEIINTANINAKITSTAILKANELMQLGIKSADALHTAIAIENDVDYFCTCDERFLKKLKTLKSPPYFVSPLELIIEVTLK